MGILARCSPLNIRHDKYKQVYFINQAFYNIFFQKYSESLQRLLPTAISTSLYRLEDGYGCYSVRALRTRLTNGMSLYRLADRMVQCKNTV